MQILQAASKHRQAIQDLTKLAQAEAMGAVQLLKDQPLMEFAGELRKTLPAIASVYGSASGLLSTTFYDQSRLQAEAAGSYTATASAIDLSIIEAGIGYTVAKQAQAATLDDVKTTLAGAVGRAVAGVDRNTIFDNSERDPFATYRRVARPDGCAFCITMAAVAEVQYTADAHAFHDHCHCVNIPVFDGQSFTEPDIYKTVRQHYSDAVSEIQVKRQLVDYNGYKRNVAAKKFPDLTLTTPNILSIVRKTTGLK